MNLQELKRKSPAELLAFAEGLQIENANSLRRQDMLFAILKHLADNDTAIFGAGVLEILQDGFGFLRSPEANYLPGTPSRGRSAAQRKASAISPFSRSTRSISKIRTRSATASISTTSPRSTRTTV
jgi:transcription termination factor Rho